MSCALTQDYSLGCQDFFGGIITSYIIEKENVTTCTVTAGTVSTLTKATGKFFRKYELEAHTGDGKETKTVNPANGTSNTKQVITFPINGMSVSVRNEIELLAQNRLIIILIDNNGNAWLYGKDFGLRLDTTSAMTGKALADRNGYDLTFGGDEKGLAPLVDPTIVAALQTAGT